MKNTLINTIILTSTVICAAQTPPPLPVLKPVFYGISKFNETNSPIWDLNDNLNSSAHPFKLNYLDFVTETGPSILSDWTLGPQEFVRAGINPKEHLQNNTNIYHNLTFYYQYYNTGNTEAKIRINNSNFCNLPYSFVWTKFSTNVNIGIVNSLSFSVNNPNNASYNPVFKVDAVQWHPIYTFPANNQTNFVVSTTGLKSNVKWNSNVYPAGSQGFKLYGSTNMINFSLITNTPVLTNGFFTVSLNKVNNEFYQLRTP
jgi:hypothetical protein